MTPSLLFLDQIDEWMQRGPSVVTAARELCLGERRVTQAGDASRIPEADVRDHVVQVLWEVARTRIRAPLADALSTHLLAAREEHEIMEGPEPTEGPGSFVRDQWRTGLRSLQEGLLAGSDVAEMLSPDEIRGALGVDGIDPGEALADAVLAAPVNDEVAALVRMGATPAAINDIVAEIRTPALSREGDPDFVPTMAEALDMDQRKLEALAESGWSLRALADWAQSWTNPDMIREGVTYVLTDSDMIATGAELLGLSGDATFLAWCDERLMFSTPDQDAVDVEEVLKLASTEGGEASASGRDISETQDVAAGAKEESAPAARAPRPAPAAESDLTRAVRVAIAVLFDHGCETDKAMAAALGVDASVVRGARKGTVPWFATEEQFVALKKLVAGHFDALFEALEGLRELTGDTM